MALVRFKLDEVKAFRNKDQRVTVKHLCIDCARAAREQYTLIPFLDGQLHGTLSDFGGDSGAMILCDKCGDVMATYCPSAWWAGHETQAPAVNPSSILFKKF